MVESIEQHYEFGVEVTMTGDIQEMGYALDAAKQNQCESIFQEAYAPQSSTEAISAQPQHLGACAANESEGDVPPTDPGSEPPPADYQRKFPENLEPWESSASIEELADEIHDMIKRHCVLPPESIDAIVLWTIASYDIDAFRIFPKLTVISPIKRCGKTTTIEAISSVCKDSLMVSNMTSSTLFRLTELGKPTLLIDEADTFVKDGDASLIGIINSGFTKSAAKVVRNAGDDFKPKTFSTWMPMVLASIGELASTVMDRSIVITLRRKKADEIVEQLPHNLDELMLDLRRKLIRWTEEMKKALRRNTQRPPFIGSDRAADCWTPLFTIADLISPRWLAKCESAYRAMTRADEPELAAQLLSDIREVLRSGNSDKIKTKDIISALTADPEKPWAGSDGKGRLTPKTLAQYLQPFAIQAHSIRFDDGTMRGYWAKDFKDAIERYVIHEEPIKPYI